MALQTVWRFIQSSSPLQPSIFGPSALPPCAVPSSIETERTMCTVARRPSRFLASTDQTSSAPAGMASLWAPFVEPSREREAEGRRRCLAVEAVPAVGLLLGLLGLSGASAAGDMTQHRQLATICAKKQVSRLSAGSRAQIAPSVRERAGERRPRHSHAAAGRRKNEVGCCGASPRQPSGRLCHPSRWRVTLPSQVAAWRSSLACGSEPAGLLHQGGWWHAAPVCGAGRGGRRARQGRVYSVDRVK